MKAESLRVSTEALNRLGCEFPKPETPRKKGQHKFLKHPDMAHLSRKEYKRETMRRRRAKEKLKQ